MPKRDFDSTNPESLETAAHDVIVTAYAVAYRMEAMLWEVANKFDAWDDENLSAARNRVQERVTALATLYHTRFAWKMHTVSFRGNFRRDYEGNLGNYDVDDALRTEFGDAVSCDSESGWFCVDATPVKADEVATYIRTNYPDMEFEMDHEDDPESFRVPAIYNWTVAKHWLAERDIEVDIEIPAPAPKTGKELEALLKTARAALEKTGLSMEEAKALL